MQEGVGMFSTVITDLHITTVCFEEDDINVLLSLTTSAIIAEG